jgi:cellulose synthase (UDP-forming)
MSDWYFKRYEQRQPPEPVPFSPVRERIFQALAIAALVLGLYYLAWRWSASLNPNALWFAIPLVVAESFAFVGSALFFLSIWRTQDTPRKPPPAKVSEILGTAPDEDRPLSVDVFFATYNEDVELVRLSIRDAKALRYPHPIDVRIHVLDDGKRPAMRAVCEEEKVNYLSRPTNIGYKAGNLRNGLEHTHGDLLVICDADTRPLPGLLEETLGYFRDPHVAWVQTPQWFYDLEEGTPLPQWLSRRLHLGRVGAALGRGVEKLIGPVRIGADLLGNDPLMFYDVIQRRRNWCNASFCCGAGSVHRRDAVMEAALKAYGNQVQASVNRFTREVPDPQLRGALGDALTAEAARSLEFTPYKFHVSEDIYTSIVLHSDSERRWKSVFHPQPLTKMLSPQDLLTWSIQRFKYAGGTLDIFWNDSPFKRPLEAWQKLMYGTTIYSYLAPLWTVVFLISPIVYLFSGVSPVSSYNAAFYAHFVPFIFINKLAFMVGTWGVPTWRGEQHYLAFFWLNLKAIRDVLMRKPIKFHVTPKTKQAGTFLSLVRPQLVVIVLSALGLIWMGTRVFVLGTGDRSAYLANLFWTLNNIFALSAIVMAALHKPKEEA